MGIRQVGESLTLKELLVGKALPIPTNLSINVPVEWKMQIGLPTLKQKLDNSGFLSGVDDAVYNLALLASLKLRPVIEYEFDIPVGLTPLVTGMKIVA